MTDDKYTWHRIPGGDIQVDENELRVVTAGRKSICITRREGKIYAFAHKCPHAGGHLADGYVDAQGNIVCPVHRYKYCLKNGYNTSGEGYYLKTYPVECREDGVYIGFARGWMPGFLKK